jgi:hypothetical protein
MKFYNENCRLKSIVGRSTAKATSQAEITQKTAKHSKPRREIKCQTHGQTWIICGMWISG